MYILRMLSYSLVIIGALNWASVGIFGFDIVASIFGDMSAMTRVIYSLVGVSAITLLATSKEIYARHCECH